MKAPTYSGQTVDLTGQPCGPLDLTDTHDATFIGARITCPTDAKAIMLRGCSGIVFRDLEIVGGLVGFTTLGCQDITVDGFTVEGFGADGFHVFSSQRCTFRSGLIRNPQTVGSKHADAAQMGGPDLEPTSDILFEGVHAEGLMQGIDNYGAKSPCSRVRVRGCSFRLGLANSITLTNVPDSEVAYCRFELGSPSKFGATKITVGPGVALHHNAMGPGVKVVRT